MPEATRYEPDNEPLRERARAEAQDRRRAIAEFWRYYEGRHRAQLAVEPGRPNDNVVIYLTTGIFDRAVAFMVPNMPKITLVGEEEDDVRLKAQADLDKFWEANGGALLLTDIATAGFVSGHNYVKIVPAIDENSYPEIKPIDAEMVTIFWDGRDRTRVVWYEIAWKDAEETEWRQDIVPNYDPEGRIVSWFIQDYFRRANRARWEQGARDDWPFPFGPLVEWKNWPAPKSAYGKSDLTHARRNDALNFVASNILRIIRFPASPQTIATGVSAPPEEADQPEIGPDTIIYISQPDAKVHNLEMQSDLASSMNMAYMLRGALYSEARVVDIETHKDRIGQLTNFGLRVLFDDQLKKTNVKRALYGKAIARISAIALALMGHEYQEPEVHWPDPLPVSEAEIAEIQKIDAELGVKSRRTMAEERGLDYDRESARMEREGMDSALMAAENLIRATTG